MAACAPGALAPRRVAVLLVALACVMLLIGYPMERSLLAPQRAASADSAPSTDQPTRAVAPAARALPRPASAPAAPNRTAPTRVASSADARRARDLEIARLARPGESCSCGASVRNWERCVQRLGQRPGQRPEELRFVQIGAHTGAGDRNDPSRSVRLSEWSGLLVEADPATFPALVANMCAPGQRHTCVNRAVCAADEAARTPTLDFYGLSADISRETGVDARTNLSFPRWAAQVASLDRARVLRFEPLLREELKARNAGAAAASALDAFELEAYVVRHEVRCQSLEALLAPAPGAAPAPDVRGGGASALPAFRAAQLLVVDTEGHDGRILRSLPLRRGGFRPRFITFEQTHLDRGERARTAAHLRDAGYVFQLVLPEVNEQLLGPGTPAAVVSRSRFHALMGHTWRRFSWLQREGRPELECIPLLANAENVFAARPAEPGEPRVEAEGSACATECPDHTLDELRALAAEVLADAAARAAHKQAAAAPTPRRGRRRQ